MTAIEELYLAKHSVIHAMDIRYRFITFLIFLPIAVFVSRALFLPIICSILVVFICLSKIKFRQFWSQIRYYVFAMTLFIFVFAIVFESGDVAWRAAQGLEMSVRFALLICLGILFSMTSDPIEVPIAMMRGGLPHRFGIVVMVAYRMIPLISDRVVSVVQVQQARGAKLLRRFPDLRRLSLELMALAIPVVLSALEISVALSDTLIARGYDPHSPAITVPPHRRTWPGLLVMLLSLALAAAAVWERKG